ncbi:ATP-dependent DNA ligase [Occultella glacieicola]|uniref:DNA ligase (ATP) n=1 Tax=Occultella glacieicola TaxID=2518684 RepID=A0ABY2DZ22_9MICO|nr:ATP-dependent DNA ligase [Occultella glacieicola]TDE89643.1 ATP-dependent DNA ligase [Occultella glacieicola]
MARNSETSVAVDGRRVRLTNLDKVLYPATGTTKAEVIAYYSEIAPVMLPHCSGRPATRKRWVNGVGTEDDPGQVFFTKNLDSGTPDWVVRAELTHSDHTNVYPLVGDRATLVWLAQMAALEIHVPQWRFDSAGRPRNPDRIVFDLDPGPGIELAQVAQVARFVREVLSGMGMDAVPVTSGSKGIHVYAALPGVHTSSQISDLAKELARSLEADHPDLVVSEMAKAKRVGKVFIDWSQNHSNKTTVAPYSLRGRHHPTVAVPRTWDELAEKDLRHLDLTEVPALVAERGDPMAALESVAHSTDTAGGHGPDRLTAYRAKRDAARTPEPVPHAAPPEVTEPVFVIQEHDASRLHWDLRLAHEGVLVSWALPKGVPTDPAGNHLAVQTEDHPMEYLTFHGSIPRGEYGAGEMTIWDTGTYDLEKWREGKEVIVTLTGADGGGLAGSVGRSARFALIRTGRRDGDDNHWLIHLMKPPGPAPNGMTADGGGRVPKDGSPGRVSPARAGRAVSASAEAPTPGTRITTTPPPRPASAQALPNHTRTAGPPTTASAKARDRVGGSTSAARSAAPPLPMLATLGSPVDVPDGPGWALEMKWDGMRAVAVVDRDADPVVRLWARSGRDITATFPELAALTDAVSVERAVLDGEIVALDAGGRPDFADLQPRMQATNPREIAAAAARRPVHLMLFDVLEVDGTELLDQRYDDRRAALETVVDAPAGGIVQVPPVFDGDLDAAVEASLAWNLEGVVAKRRDSRYLPGRRASSWIKIKHTRTQDVVVGGWRPGQGGRTGQVGSLLAGVFDDDGALHYVGRVGSGFTAAETSAWVREFTSTARDRSPFEEVPALDARDAHWLEPTRVGEVAFGEWTPTGRLRHPRWRGWRPDLDPATVRRNG